MQTLVMMSAPQIAVKYRNKAVAQLVTKAVVTLLNMHTSIVRESISNLSRRVWRLD
jgi:hypothetical protein